MGFFYRISYLLFLASRRILILFARRVVMPTSCRFRSIDNAAGPATVSCTVDGE